MTTLLPLVQSRIKYTEVNFGWMVLFNRTYQNALFKKTTFDNAVETSLIDCGTCLHCDFISVVTWSLEMLKHELERNSFTLKAFAVFFFTDTGLYIT